MAEPTGILVGAKQLWMALSGVVTAIFLGMRWYFRRLVGKVDGHANRIQELERHLVTNESLDKTTLRLESAIKDMHLDVRERIKEVKDSSDAAHHRMDEWQRDQLRNQGQ